MRTFRGDAVSGKKGMTLVELLVVISIAGIISAVLFANYPAYDENKKLLIAAEEVALTLREAQVFGLSVRSDDPSAPMQTFSGRYGININTVTRPNDITLFVDNGTGAYEEGIDLKDIASSITLASPISLKAICFNESGQSPASGGVEECNTSSGIPGVLSKVATVLFERPNPEPSIKNKFGQLRQYLRIILTNGRIDRNIYVWASGQIAVTDPSDVIYIP